MQKMLLLGVEAIGQAAIDAGISAVFAYPGTPSTEITEYVQASREARDNKVVASWTANERQPWKLLWAFRMSASVPWRA